MLRVYSGGFWDTTLTAANSATEAAEVTNKARDMAMGRARACDFKWIKGLYADGKPRKINTDRKRK